MADTIERRIMKELTDVRECTDCGISLEIVNDTFTELKGQIAGPPDSPYEGGNFILEIKLSNRYPFVPPKVRFVTKIWHPNISLETGAVCLDILEHHWCPSTTMRPLLLSVQSILGAADPENRHDVVARQYIEDPEMFKLTARHWAQVYAGAPCHSDFDIMIKRLMDMGADEHKARVALSSCSWNLEKAIESLFS